MRTAHIEIDKTVGTDWPPLEVEHQGKNWTLESIYREAGYEVSVNQSDGNIMLPSTGDSFDLATLHRLMTENRKTGAGWLVHVMIVPNILYMSGTGLQEPLGIMYDIRTADGDPNRIPREGCAINYSKVKMLGDGRAYLRTVAHEIGHVFNLLHPKDESMPISTTLMNQTGDLQRLGGFPGNISFDFSEANKAFLNDAPAEYVQPGGLPFGSRPPSFLDLNFYQESTLSQGLHLELQLAYSEIDLGEPVLLRAVLTNGGQVPLTLSSRIDPSAGDLSVTIETPDKQRFEFRPVYIECGDDAVGILEPGRNWVSAFPVFYGATGHSFPADGVYKIMATYVSSVTSNGAYVAVAQPVQLLVRRQDTMSWFADTMMDDNAALFMVLGGGAHLEGAIDRLSEIAKRVTSRAAVLPRISLAADSLRPGADRSTLNKAIKLLEEPVLARNSDFEALRSHYHAVASLCLHDADPAFRASKRAEMASSTLGRADGKNTFERIEQAAKRILRKGQ